MLTHEAVSYEVRAQNLIAGMVFTQQHRPPAAADVPQKRGALIFEIDEIGDAVATGNHHRVDFRVGQYHVFRHLHGANGRGAAIVNVYGPGVGGSNFVSHVNARCPE